MKPLTIKFFGTEVSKFKTIILLLLALDIMQCVSLIHILSIIILVSKIFPFGVLLRRYCQIHNLAISLLKLKILEQLDYGEVIDIYPLIIYG